MLSFEENVQEIESNLKNELFSHMAKYQNKKIRLKDVKALMREHVLLALDAACSLRFSCDRAHSSAFFIKNRISANEHGKLIEYLNDGETDLRKIVDLFNEARLQERLHSIEEKISTLVKVLKYDILCQVQFGAIARFNGFYLTNTTNESEEFIPIPRIIKKKSKNFKNELDKLVAGTYRLSFIVHAIFKDFQNVYKIKQLDELLFIRLLAPAIFLGKFKIDLYPVYFPQIERILSKIGGYPVQTLSQNQRNDFLDGYVTGFFYQDDEVALDDNLQELGRLHGYLDRKKIIMGRSIKDIMPDNYIDIKHHIGDLAEAAKYLDDSINSQTLYKEMCDPVVFNKIKIIRLIRSIGRMKGEVSIKDDDNTDSYNIKYFNRDLSLWFIANHSIIFQFVFLMNIYNHQRLYPYTEQCLIPLFGMKNLHTNFYFWEKKRIKEVEDYTLYNMIKRNANNLLELIHEDDYVGNMKVIALNIEHEKLPSWIDRNMTHRAIKLTGFVVKDKEADLIDFLELHMEFSDNWDYICLNYKNFYKDFNERIIMNLLKQPLAKKWFDEDITDKVRTNKIIKRLKGHLLETGEAGEQFSEFKIVLYKLHEIYHKYRFFYKDIFYNVSLDEGSSSDDLSEEDDIDLSNIHIEAGEDIFPKLKRLKRKFKPKKQQSSLRDNDFSSQTWIRDLHNQFIQPTYTKELPK